MEIKEIVANAEELPAAGEGTPVQPTEPAKKVVMLTEKEIKQLLKAAAREGVAAYKSEQAKLMEERTERVRNSTKTLLKHYRRLQKMRGTSVYDPETVTDPTLAEIFDMIRDECQLGTFSLTSTKKNAIITGMIMDHVDVQLSNYEKECAASDIPEIQRRFRIVSMMFLQENPLRVEEIAEAESLDKSNVYRTLEKAYDDLTALFFGIEGLDVAEYRRRKREEKMKHGKNRAKKSQ